jgi:hypothetical protein
VSTSFQIEPPSPRDPYWKVTVSPAGSPFRTVLRFARTASELILAGVSIEQPPPEEVEEGELKNITAPTVRDLANHWSALEDGARAYLAVLSEGSFSTKDVARVRTRRVLSGEFLADVVRRHASYRAQGISANQALAREERVSVSTVKNWLAKARQAGIEGS